MISAPHPILRGLYARAASLPRAMEHLLLPDLAFAGLSAEIVDLEIEPGDGNPAPPGPTLATEPVRRTLERRAAREQARHALRPWVENIRNERSALTPEEPRAPAPLPWDWQITAGMIAAHTALRTTAPTDEVIALLARARHLARRKRVERAAGSSNAPRSSEGREADGSPCGANSLPLPWAPDRR